MAQAQSHASVLKALYRLWASRTKRKRPMITEFADTGGLTEGVIRLALKGERLKHVSIAGLSEPPMAG